MINALNLDFLRTRTVPDMVQQEIMRMIKVGEIAAGAKLNEITFAEHLGVSRAPIREAFRALEEAGLVKLHKNRGVFVREIGAGEAFELYRLRATLDEMAGRELAVSISAAQIEELQLFLGRLEQAAVTGIGAYFPLNIAFHDRIVEMTNNAVLLEFYRRVIDRMHLLRRRSFDASDGSSLSRVEHGLIVDALAAGNAERAGKMMRDHVENGYERFHSLG
jgi:DNA-binding GntR family transcriptional regulator